ncbi:MAG: pseudouridine synthase [Lachnospiraceae bacterium]
MDNISTDTEKNNNQQVRLNKYLSEHGVCSRREADRLIEAGRVTVDGRKAVTGMKILPLSVVCIDGKKLEEKDEMILIALNKPVGIECTAAKDVKNNIVDFVGLEKRVYPVGRLDKNSEGLILLTNNGDIVNKIMKASACHEKEYIVTVNRDITDDFIYKMSNGIHLRDTRNGKVILDEVTRKCKVYKINKRTFGIILTQGINRQIRRMCRELGCNVVALKRVRIMNIQLGDLKIGQYRNVTDDEYKELMRKIT